MATLSIEQENNGVTTGEFEFDLTDPAYAEWPTAEALFNMKRAAHLSSGWTVQNMGPNAFRATKVGKRTRVRTFRLRN